MEEAQAVARKLLSSNVAVAAFGNVHAVPSFSTIEVRLGQILCCCRLANCIGC